MAEVAAFSDSSPLVYFAKLRTLSLLNDVVGPIGLPPAVYQEVVVAGKARGKPDAVIIERALDGGSLVRYEMDDRERDLANELALSGGTLGPGECEAIACAEARNVQVLLQDRKARAMAIARGVSILYPRTVLVSGLVRRRINLEEFNGLVFGLARLTNMGVDFLLEMQQQAAEIDRALGKVTD